MKLYESDYSTTTNIAAPPRLARSASRLSVLVSGRPVPGQDGELSRGRNRVAGSAKADSNYKRIQRFLRSFEINYDQIAQRVVRLVEIPKPWVLSVDQTTWEFGSLTINVLMLGVVHQGIAFPLFWHLLDKRGNSNTEERFDQLVEFLCVFAPEDIAYLTADREFIGAQVSYTGGVRPSIARALTAALSF